MRSWTVWSKTEFGSTTLILLSDKKSSILKLKDDGARRRHLSKRSSMTSDHCETKRKFVDPTVGTSGNDLPRAPSRLWAHDGTLLRSWRT